MKKIIFKAEAVLIAVSVFFCSIIYKPVEVKAAVASFTLGDVVIWAFSLIAGHYVAEPTFDWIDEKLGWTDSDIKTDAEGNVIISPEQIEEIKKAGQEELNNQWAEIPGASIRSCEIDDPSTIGDNTGATTYAMTVNGPATYRYYYPYSTVRYQITKLIPGYYVALSDTEVAVYNHNLVAQDLTIYEWGYPAYQDPTLIDTGSALGQLFGGDILVFESQKALSDYLSSFDDPLDAPVFPYTADLCRGTEYEIRCYDYETEAELSIFDVDLDLSKGLVFTPSGSIYLNYSDANENGIPDDHDTDLKSGEWITLFEDKENGWSSGDVQLSGSWSDYDMLSFSYGTVQEGGYGGFSSGVWYISTADIADMDIIIFTSWNERCFKIQKVDGDNTKLNCFYTYGDQRPVVYVVRGYKFSSSGSGGGSPGSVDLSETNNRINGIQETLNDILKWIKKIYNQVVVGNVISAVDAVAQVMDTAKDYVDEALEDTASIAELGEALTTKFPFSLPSTLLALVTVFEAEPVTPVFEVPFVISSLQIKEKFVLDFSMFDEIIFVLQWFLRLIWIYGLIRLTPNFIDVGGLTSGGDGGSS
ncbi:MAG: hypothetical protein ACI4AA_10745 [Lachnospiraceae bacterium]